MTTATANVRKTFIVCYLLITASYGQPITAARSTPSARQRTVLTSEGDIHIGLMARSRSSSDGGTSCDKWSAMACASGLEPVRFALNRLNSRTDILQNITVGYAAIDDCGTALGGLAAAYDLINVAGAASDNVSVNNVVRNLRVVGVVGFAGSNSASLSSGLLGMFNVPHISTYATSDIFSDKTTYKYFRRLVSPDSVQVRAILDLCQFYGWTYVSLVYSAGSYGENAASMIDQALRSSESNYTICLAAVQKAYSDATPRDIKRIVLTLVKYSAARVVILYLSGKHHMLFTSAVSSTTGRGRFLWVAGDSFSFYAGSSYTDVMDRGIYVDHPSAVMPAYVDYMKTLSPWNTGGNPWLTEYWEYTYHCSSDDPLNVTGQACPLNATFMPENCEYHWSIIPRLYDAVFVIADAVHRLITDRCPDAFTDKTLLKDCIDGPSLLKYLQTTDYNGLIGRIEFDSGGNIRENLSIYQFQQGVAVKVGQWSEADSAVHVDHRAISWSVFASPSSENNSGIGIPASVCALPCKCIEYVIPGDVPCCWTCKACRDNEIVTANRTSCAACPMFTWPDDSSTFCSPIEPTYLTATNSISISLLVMATAGVACSMTVISIYVAKRQHKLVMATNVPLSVIILIGTLTAAVSIFVFVVRPSSGSVCIIRSFGFYCSVNLMCAPLCLKNILIYRIFKAGAKKLSFNSVKTHMLFTAVGFMIQVILTGISELVATSSARLRMPNIFDKYVELYCYKSAVWFLIPQMYNIILMVFCAGVGFLTRRLPENFNESWFIFVSVSTTLFAWIVLIPVYFTSYYAYMQSAILGFCLAISCFVTLACQFVPIIYAVIFVPTDRIKISAGFETSSTAANKISVQPSTPT